MKKIALFLVLGVMTFGVCACGNGNGEQGSGSGDAGTEASTVESVPTQEDTQDTDTDNGSGDIAGGGLGEEGGWSAKMQAIRDAVAEELGDNYWPSMEITADMLEGMYGVTADMLDDYMGEVPMMSAHVDTLVIVKAKDGQTEAVENALNAYREGMISNTMQYPMNIGKIQASKVERIGDYVCFVQLGGDVTDAEAEGDEAIIRHCQEQNDRAIEVIAAEIEQ